ncbi:universal stress protein [Sphaerisporangium rufum]|uniref:Universal stress protein n=1 Tax=Sphaerisporangium rufum TaxID=1381558 RepID=A0A919RAZ9_9ACTN|nr:universal stress protein [Sphaerisporangium rufum]GII81676.1 universal stress protein [Sphaerisporangium rufum]
MIVAGVDGSAAGLAAARWAAAEAELRGTPLLLAHAMPAWACEDAGGPYQEVARWMRDGADQVLAGALEQTRAAAPAAEVTTARLPGDPRTALVEAAAPAELLAVGNHGLGGFRGLLLGSVALGVAGRAGCPVAVVRTPPAPPRPEIVLAVDGAPGTGPAIAFAFEEAARRRVALLAVHAADARPGPGRTGDLPAAALAGARERHPDVKVTERAIAGHPVEVLLGASGGAELLVAGSRGRGAGTGLLLGSVSHALLHHATCPVVIVPTGRD